MRAAAPSSTINEFLERMPVASCATVSQKRPLTARQRYRDTAGELSWSTERPMPGPIRPLHSPLAENRLPCRLRRPQCDARLDAKRPVLEKPLHSVRESPPSGQ